MSWCNKVTKIFYVNGCSHTAGSEMEAIKSKGSDYDKQHCYAKYIHSEFFPDSMYINEAYSGKSNETIALETINSCLGLLENSYMNGPYKSEDIFVLIGLTDPNRYQFDVPSSYGVWKDTIRFFVGRENIDPAYRSDTKHVPYTTDLWRGLNAIAHTEEQEYRNFAKDYISLVNFLELYNIDYRLVQVLWSYEQKFAPVRSKKIFEHYFKNDKVVNKEPWADNMTMFLWLENQGFDPNMDGRNSHFREDAHKAWAEFLIEKRLKI